MYLFSPVQKPSAIYENKPAISLFRDYVIIDDLNGNKVEQDKAMGLSSSYCTSFSDAQWENKNIEIPTALSELKTKEVRFTTVCEKENMRDNTDKFLD